MTNTPITSRKAFEKWMIDTAKIIIGSNDPYPAHLEREYYKVWQASKAHNDAVIAELAEALEVLKNAAIDSQEIFYGSVDAKYVIKVCDTALAKIKD